MHSEKCSLVLSKSTECDCGETQRELAYAKRELWQKAFLVAYPVSMDCVEFGDTHQDIVRRASNAATDLVAETIRKNML
jgi:hypothetical protein